MNAVRQLQDQVGKWQAVENTYICRRALSHLSQPLEQQRMYLTCERFDQRPPVRCTVSDSHSMKNTWQGGFPGNNLFLKIGLMKQ